MKKIAGEGGEIRKDLQEKIKVRQWEQMHDM